MIRRTPMSAVAQGAAALALVACSSVTDASETPRVTLLIQRTSDSGIIAPSVSVSGQDVVVRGTFSTPCLGYGVSATARQTADALVVTLSGRQGGEICLTAIGRFPYIGTVSGASSGTRTVVVRHVIEDANWPVDTVINTRVVIP